MLSREYRYCFAEFAYIYTYIHTYITYGYNIAHTRSTVSVALIIRAPPLLQLATNENKINTELTDVILLVVIKDKSSYQATDHTIYYNVPYICHITRVYK